MAWCSPRGPNTRSRIAAQRAGALYPDGAMKELLLAKPPSSDRESAPNKVYDDRYGEADIATPAIER